MPRQAITHYMVDCFFTDAKGFDGFRKESHHIRANSDKDAIREVSIIEWRKPHHYHLRAVTRKSDRVIYKSTDA